MRWQRWLIPIGYVGLCVLAWYGGVSGDDGSGLSFLGVFLLALPWMLAATVLDTERSGSFVVAAVGMGVNAAIVCAWAMHALSNSVRRAIGIAALALATVAALR